MSGVATFFIYLFIFHFYFPKFRHTFKIDSLFPIDCSIPVLRRKEPIRLENSIFTVFSFLQESALNKALKPLLCYSESKCDLKYKLEEDYAKLKEGEFWIRIFTVNDILVLFFLGGCVWFSFLFFWWVLGFF